MEQFGQSSFKEKVGRILPEFGDTNTLEALDITAETFSFFEDSLLSQNFKKYTDPAEAYRELENITFIVRREDPRKVLQLLQNENYKIDFDSDRYSNCVEWNPAIDGVRGITNAYLEGMTNLNNVVTIIGFKAEEDADIQQLPDATPNFHGLDRDKVRSFKGEINPDIISFISLRVPGHLLHESDLTENELSRIDEYLEKKELGEKVNPVMIHRTFLRETPVVSMH